MQQSGCCKGYCSIVWVQPLQRPGHRRMMFWNEAQVLKQAVAERRDLSVVKEIRLRM